MKFSLSKAGLSPEELLIVEAKLCNPLLRNEWAEFSAKARQPKNDYDPRPLVGALARHVITIAECRAVNSESDGRLSTLKELLNEIEELAESRRAAGERLLHPLDVPGLSSLFGGSCDDASERVKANASAIIETVLMGSTELKPAAVKSGFEQKRRIVQRMLNYFFGEGEHGDEYRSYLGPPTRELRFFRSRAEAYYLIRWYAQSWPSFTKNPSHQRIALISGWSETPALNTREIFETQAGFALLAAAVAGFTLVYVVPSSQSGKEAPALRQARHFLRTTRRALGLVASAPENLPDEVKAVLLAGTCHELMRNERVEAIRLDQKIELDRKISLLVSEIGETVGWKELTEKWLDRFHVISLDAAARAAKQKVEPTRLAGVFFHPFFRYLYFFPNDKRIGSKFPEGLQVLVTDDSGRERIISNVGDEANVALFRGWWEAFVEPRVMRQAT